MANLFGLAGAQPQKQTRFAPIYTGRWASGIWTNRSPLRDAATTRISEKFYGSAGDALIDGSNIEITNRLTLARRPGNPVYDSNSYTSVDRFYELRLFNSTTEQIDVMIDQSSALYSLYNGIKTLVWNKSAGAGQSYMQSVGNSLYWGNGVDNKKWLQTLTVWTASKDWTGPSTPLLSTFFIDPNGNIQQLTTAGVSGISAPTWSTTVPASGNNFQGGTTADGTAVWTNRGNPTKNWGIAAPLSAPSPVIGSSRSAWAKNTYYSIAGAVIDSNGNLQQVTTKGTSGATTPAWSTVLNATTTDGTVTWKMIQTAASLAWSAHTAYAPGSYLVGNASGTNCLFQLAALAQPSISGNVSAYLYAGPTSGPVGCFILTNPTSTGSALASATTLSSLSFNGANGPQPIAWDTINGAGEVTGTTTPFPSYSANYQLIILGSLHVPVAGQYTFTVKHHDGMIWGMGGGATLVSGTKDNPIGQSVTAAQGYNVLGGTNRGLEGGGLWTDTFTVNIPTAGTIPFEFDYSYWYHSGQTFSVQCNGQVIASGAAESGTTAPIWPAWGTSYAPNYPSVTEAAGQLQWNNIGPAADFAWVAKTGFTLPATTITDPAGNTEFPYRTGATGTVQPTFATGLSQLTLDNPNLIWINQGAASAPPVGSVSTYNGGWKYCLALVNTLDDTVSNATPLTPATGNFIGASGVTFPAGSGLDVTKIDPQADYVAIFRTTDGQAVPFLIPGSTTEFTLPLATYLASGYVDTTPDTGLNNLISAPINGENTPPGVGAQNLTFHLNRIFFSIGNTVYWTAGPDTPVGNGVNGVPPLNFDNFPSLVKRIVPTASGAMVFTVSDVYLIQGSGTQSSPIQSGIPILQGVGLLNYNALDVNGSIIGFFSSDSQFIIIDPSSGVSFAGFPIGDQFRLNNGKTGQSWNPANVYVAWHVSGEDQAWYVADGQSGWYRLMPTPAPETGYTWSPYASVVGGCQAVQSIEVSPGVHKLLLGPVTTGPILNRDLAVFQDNGNSYPAYATIGSAVLAQPGQIATVSFITTESVRTGTPLTLGLLIDEALPYYTGPFDLLKQWVNDPPGLKESRSFYLSELEDDAAAMRHCQIRVQWPAEAVQNELLSLTVYGGFFQEN
jgi:hypothetical protein